MNKEKRALLFLDSLIVAVLLVFDQFTKYLAVQRLQGKDAFVLIKGVLELNYLENRGAAFGMLQNQKVFLVGVAVLFILAIGYVLIKLPSDKKYVWLHLLLTVIVAGGLGNMVDRIRLEYVVDFIYFVLIDFPIFNVADIYVVTATFGMVFLLLFVYKDEDLEKINLFSGKTTE